MRSLPALTLQGGQGGQEKEGQRQEGREGRQEGIRKAEVEEVICASIRAICSYPFVAGSALRSSTHVQSHCTSRPLLLRPPIAVAKVQRIRGDASTTRKDVGSPRTVPLTVAGSRTTTLLARGRLDARIHCSLESSQERCDSSSAPARTHVVARRRRTRALRPADITCATACAAASVSSWSSSSRVRGQRATRC